MESSLGQINCYALFEAFLEYNLAFSKDPIKKKRLRMMANLDRQRVDPAHHSLRGSMVLGEVVYPSRTDANAIIALLSRVLLHSDVVKGDFKEVEEPTIDVSHSLSEFLTQFSYFAKRYHVVPFTQDEYIDHFDGKRRKVYQRAAEELAARGLTSYHTRIRAFLKIEKLAQKPNKVLVPRIIQPRHPCFNLSLGCFLYPAEHVIYRTIADLGSQYSGYHKPVVMKGFNSESMSRIINDKFETFSAIHGASCIVGFDANRFDQHINSDLLHFERCVYNCLLPFKRYPVLEELLLQQVVNRCTLRGANYKWAYTTVGRMSGDVNTSLGNIIVMCAIVYSYSIRLNVPFDVINNGDDCAVIIRRVDQHLFDGFSDYTLSVGVPVAVEPTVYDLLDFTFCQCVPFKVGNDCIMVRHPDSVLKKDVSTSLSIAGDGVRKWFYAVGTCGMAAFGGVPILQELYAYMLRNSTKSNVNIDGGLAWMSKGMDRRYGEVVGEWRVAFARAFGYSPDQQLAFEREIAAFPDVAAFSKVVFA